MLNVVWCFLDPWYPNRRILAWCDQTTRIQKWLVALMLCQISLLMFLCNGLNAKSFSFLKVLVQTPASSSWSHVSRRAMQWTQIRDFQFVFCLQIHALAGDTMNSKLFLMHSASLLALIKFLVYLLRQRVRVFVNKSLIFRILFLRNRLFSFRTEFVNFSFLDALISPSKNTINTLYLLSIIVV